MNTLDQQHGLVFRDCILLAEVFEQQASVLFPFPASVCLYVVRHNEKRPDKKRWPSCLADQVQSAARGKNRAPAGYRDEAVYCRLDLLDSGIAYLVFTGVDAALLKKFSREWYVSFQEQVNQCLLAIRDGYIDPETGLYNRRALLTYLQTECVDNQNSLPGTLYLVHLSFVRRSIPGTFRRIHYFADLLATVENQGLFSLGQNIFALLIQTSNPEEERILARRLQRFLRREKLRQVHISFADCPTFAQVSENDGGSGPFARMMDALALAERRGPFGICDARVLDGQAMHPFVMPPRAVVRKMQRLWRKMDRFCLALFAQQSDKEEGNSLAPALADLVSAEHRRIHTVPTGSEQCFVLFPFTDCFDPDRCIEKLHRSLQQRLHTPVSVGFCSYPETGDGKTACIRHCYKALMHGTFLGDDSVVRFDHVSLNVSGDWYFEQGDFRQAVREYSEGLKYMPGEKNLLNSLGVALIEMKRIHQAVTAFQEVLAQDPDNLMALVNLGYAYQEMRWPEKALACFEKAHAVQYHAGLEGGVDVLRQLSRLYIYFNRFQDALVTLQRWQQVEDTEQDFLFHQLLGRTYFETKAPGQAMKSLQRALLIHPRDAESMSLLGLLYVLEDEGKDAGESLLQKAIALQESESVHWFRYATALQYMNRIDDALVAVRKTLLLQRTSVDARLLLAELLIKRQRLWQARQHVQRALQQKKLSRQQKKKAEKIFSDFFANSKKET